jgi:hypothetical protein
MSPLPPLGWIFVHDALARWTARHAPKNDRASTAAPAEPWAAWADAVAAQQPARQALRRELLEGRIAAAVLAAREDVIGIRAGAWSTGAHERALMPGAVVPLKVTRRAVLPLRGVIGQSHQVIRQGPVIVVAADVERWLADTSAESTPRPGLLSLIDHGALDRLRAAPHPPSLADVMAALERVQQDARTQRGDVLNHPEAEQEAARRLGAHVPRKTFREAWKELRAAGSAACNELHPTAGHRARKT